MVEPGQLGIYIGTVAVVALGVIIRSARHGRLARVFDKYVRSSDVNGKLDEIDEVVRETNQLTKENREQINHLGEAIVLLHKDDSDVDVRQLRRKVDVDNLQTDIFNMDDEQP